MTGEITITRLVLPIGGVKEKVLAARRAEFTRIILPRQNEANLHDLPDDVRSETDPISARDRRAPSCASDPGSDFEELDSRHKILVARQQLFVDRPGDVRQHGPPVHRVSFR